MYQEYIVKPFVFDSVDVQRGMDCGCHFLLIFFSSSITNVVVYNIADLTSLMFKQLTASVHFRSLWWSVYFKGDCRVMLDFLSFMFWLRNHDLCFATPTACV